MVCAPVRSLKLGDYLSVQAHKPCSISHLSLYFFFKLRFFFVFFFLQIAFFFLFFFCFFFSNCVRN